MASTSSERSRYLAIEVVVSIVVDIPTCKDLSRACHGSSVPSQKAPHRLIHRVSPAESLRFVQFVEQINYEKTWCGNLAERSVPDGIGYTSPSPRWKQFPTFSSQLLQRK